MQEGIGRGGYRLLGWVFFALGLLGLVTTWSAFNQIKNDAGLYDWLGFGLSTLAMGCLFTLLLVVLAKPSEAKVTFTPTPPSFRPAAPTAANAPLPVPEPEPENDPNIEFNDAIPVTGPETIVPIPRPAPVVQPNRNLGMDTKGWPQRKGPSGITRREMMERLRAEEPPLVTNGSSSKTALVPTILAKPASEAPRNDGTSKGKCGGCGALLLAPSQRPVNIKCPRCDKVTLIQ